MTDEKSQLFPYRRYNPLNESWVLVSPHRMNRPWQGQSETPEATATASHDSTCYLCAGNTRISGAQNPDYKGVYVFENDYAALLPDAPVAPSAEEDQSEGLFVEETAAGECHVICYSEDHGKTLAELAVSKIVAVIDVWQEQLKHLSKSYAWVQIFENKGALNGCSNPHPHGQIWASRHIPTEIVTEDRSQKAYQQKHGQAMLLEYALAESEKQERVVCENADWIVLVPYWASWPFETLLLPQKPLSCLSDCTADAKESLALILKALTVAYDNLFQVPFPYSMGWHMRPATTEAGSHWQLHAHFYPPLLRSATVRKFMVGYEMMCETQRDITPEKAAEILRSQPKVHYRERR